MSIIDIITTWLVVISTSRDGYIDKDGPPDSETKLETILSDTSSPHPSQPLCSDWQEVDLVRGESESDLFAVEHLETWTASNQLQSIWSAVWGERTGLFPVPGNNYQGED